MLTVAAINFLIGKELKKHLTNVRKGNKRLFKASLGPSLEILQQLLKHSRESLSEYIKWIGDDERKNLFGSLEKKFDLLKKLENYLNTLIKSISTSIKNRDSSLSVKDKHFKNAIDREAFQIEFDIKKITGNNVGDQDSIKDLTKNFKDFFDLLSEKIYSELLNNLSSNFLI